MAGLNSDQESTLMNSINITPFVDVVLVLLVIFMVTAPMMMKDILGLQLPKSAVADGQITPTMGLAVNRDGQFLLDGQPVDDEGLQTAVRQALQQNAQIQGVIAADTETSYGRVARMIELLKLSGLDKFAIQIERTEATGSAPAGP